MTNTTEHGRIISSFSGQEITNTEVTRGVILPEKGTKEFNELFPVVDIEWLFSLVLFSSCQTIREYVCSVNPIPHP